MNLFKRFAVLFAAMLLVSMVASAQTTSSLTGKVTLGGNPLPGATVTISSPTLQGLRTAVSDVNGNYNFGAIPPGTFTVKFEMESMQTVNKTVVVTLSGTARADAELKLTAVAEAITVTATAPAVLETNEVQTNVQQQLVNNLPMGRSLTSTTSLAPGVTTVSGVGGAAAGSIVISGAPAFDSIFMVNGATVNENLRGQPQSLFIEDAIQETTVLQGGAISAEYGRFTGGVVNAITKSGGNQFSGTFRDTLSNNKWTAINTAFYRANGSPSVPQGDKINSVYEATLGGRIIKDRLWFFAAGRFAKSDQTLALTDANATPYVFEDKNTRGEAKLTGQITDKHSLVVSYVGVKNPQLNNCFQNNCHEFSQLDVSRSLPNNFITGHYSGILTNSFLVEANYSKRYFAFQGSGGDFSDFAHGSYVLDDVNGGYLGGPVFCGFCDKETRNNYLYNAKATWYLASKSMGTSSIVAGYENWAEQRKANNYQSGSNFAVYLYHDDDIAGNCINGVCHPTIVGSTTPEDQDGDLIKWNPILQLTQGSDFKTQSLFVNDKWDFNTHWQFNLGLRYDKNHGTDGSGNLVAKDSALSPRLGAIWDISGNGKYRVNASYSKYVSRIAESIGGAGAAGGNPAYLYYQYLGPTINADHSLTTPQALQQLYDWFLAQGGTSATDLVTRGAIPGVSQHVLGSLKSPSVQEYTLGFGTQLSSKAFVRADAIHRKWGDFYTLVTDRTTGSISPVFSGVTLPTVDVGYFTNDNSDYKRTYDALEVQGAYQATARTNIGANYTYSKLRGNVISETGGSGPSAQQVTTYPEYKAYANANPVGYLPGDQRHKARAWISYDQPTPVGSVNLSLLQRYDSGTPYSVLANINPVPYVTNVPVGTYAHAPTATPYYFSARGALRWDNISSTDAGATYELPVAHGALYVQAKMLNVFNEQGQITGSTGVLVGSKCSAVLGHACTAFNPFTQTPVEGVNFVKSAAFGKPTAPTTTAGATFLAPTGSYQLPRTYYFSGGFRF